MSDRFQQRAEPSPAGRRLFILIAVLLPVLVLVAFELLFRWFGYGGYEPLLKPREQTPQGTIIETDQAGVKGFFFANPGRAGYSRQFSFYSPKAEGTVRILLVGGSVIKGFPQTRRFAVDAFLQEMLNDVWPQRSVEVINLGTTAVASFPVRKLLRQALAYEPDLVVVYTGHNEFYGAYGVASSNQAGSTPAMLELQYHVRGLAIVRGLTRLMRNLRGVKSGSMMEIMVGKDDVGTDSWKREAASKLLFDHVGSMIGISHERDVPVLVCTLPSNERDLAPIGSSPDDGDEAGVVASARRDYHRAPEAVIRKLTAFLMHRPGHAHAHFFLGKAYFAHGEYQKAQQHFVRARDLDPMPWRATTASQQSLRRVAIAQGAQLCEAEKAFRRHSPGGSIGWELMDDHVHPSLPGQALLARTILETLSERTDDLSVARERVDSLPDWTVYAQRLGNNPYNRYAVAHTLRTLFTVPFLQQSNPQALRRFNTIALDLENRMSPAIRDIAWQWQKHLSLNIVRQPISGMVAHAMLDESRDAEALALFEVAAHSVPVYSWMNLEYVYHWLNLKNKLHGDLSAVDLSVASEALARGKVLLQRGEAEPAERQKFIDGLQRLIEAHNNESTI